MCRALGWRSGARGGRISELLEMKVPRTLGKLAMPPSSRRWAVSGPRSWRRAPCRGRAPSRRGEPGRIPFLTTGGRRRRSSPSRVITRYPARGIRNVGMYRVQVLGRDTLAMPASHKFGRRTGARWPPPRAHAGGLRPRRDPASILPAPRPSAHHRRVSLRRIPPPRTRGSHPRGTCDLEVPRRRSWCSKAT